VGLRVGLESAPGVESISLCCRASSLVSMPTELSETLVGRSFMEQGSLRCEAPLRAEGTSIYLRGPYGRKVLCPRRPQ
jgi:hypothetical protein